MRESRVRKAAVHGAALRNVVFRGSRLGALALLSLTWSGTAATTTEAGAAVVRGGDGATSPASPAARPADVGQVIDAVLEAYGGREAVLAVESHRQEGMLVARNGGAHAQLTRISTSEEGLSVLVQYPSRIELRIVAEGQGWRGASVAEISEVRGPMLQAMIAQAARARLPRLLDDRRGDVSVVSSGAEGAVLYVDLSPELALRVFVAPGSGRIRRTESVLKQMPALPPTTTTTAEQTGCGSPFTKRRSRRASTPPLWCSSRWR